MSKKRIVVICPGRGSYTRETNNYFNELSNKISEKVLNGESISNIAKNFNLTKEVIENLTQDYSSNDESKREFDTRSQGFGSHEY